MHTDEVPPLEMPISDDELTSIIWSGEMLDIVLSSLNNLYGKEKAWHSMQYGIYLPITKYIDELVQITGATVDDKSDKRRIRLLFLQKCEDDPYLNLFFTLLLCWLNGGGDKKGPYSPGEYSFSQYYQQKLILTVSGGNIITIFAKLLQNIVWAFGQNKPTTTMQEFFNNITTTNREILNEMENYAPDGTTKFHILNHIAQLLVKPFGSDTTSYVTPTEHFPNTISGLIEHLLSISYFSDFDYGIVPNKDPATKDMSDTESSQYIDSIFSELETLLNDYPGAPQGFTLFRVKSSVTCAQPKLRQEISDYIKFGKQQCIEAARAGLIPAEIIDRLMPQQINTKDREYPALQTEEYKPCKTYIDFLLDKKAKIQSATKFNIYTIINFFSLALQNSKLDERLAAGKYQGPNDWTTEGIIFYINYTAYHLNEYIKLWERTFLGNPYKDICKSFLSLQSIVESEYLLSLSSSLIIYYLNYPGPLKPLSISLTEKILDKIKEDIPGVIPQCSTPSMLPSKLTFVNSTNNRELGQYIKRFMVKPLQAIRFSEFGFPDGINIVLNIISPTQVTLTKPVDTLTTLFDQLSVEGSHYTDSEVVLPSQARQGGKKLKKSKKNKKSRKLRKSRKPKKSRKSRKSRKPRKPRKLRKSRKSKRKYKH